MVETEHSIMSEDLSQFKNHKNNQENILIYKYATLTLGIIAATEISSINIISLKNT